MSKKIFDLCFHTGQDKEAVDWFLKLKSGFESKGISVMAFTLSEKVAQAWHDKGMHDYILVTEMAGEPDIPAAAAFAGKLGISNFRLLYQTPQIFYDLSEAFCQRKMAAYIHSIMALNAYPRAKVYWTYGGDEFDHNCLRLVSRLHGGKTIYSQSSNMKGHIAIFQNEDRYWKIPDGPVPEPGEKEVDELKAYVKSYVNAKTVLWGDPKAKDVIWRWRYIPATLRRFFRTDIDPESNPQSATGFKMRNFLNRAYNRYATKRYYADPLPFITNEAEFVYFPLHYPKDSQLTLRGKPFMDQASVVETVARYLPFPYTLLVKEHPHARGWYKKNDVMRMAKIPNVKLIHPFTNSHNLIPNAKGIIAINSSVGYEGILYQKPVITMGRSFYRGQGMTIDVGSMYELEQAFERMETFKINEHQVLDFLWRMKCHSYPATRYFDKSDQNISLIINGSLDYLKRYNLI